MQRGLDLEPIARKKFSDETGIYVEPKLVVNCDLEWQFASLDGIDENESVIVEIKCPGAKDHLTARDGMIPGKYYPQLQHQLCVTGLKRGYYYSFDGQDGVLVEFMRDDDYIEKLIEKEKEFYQKMIDFEPPLLVEKDIVILDDPEWSDICEEYKRIKGKIDDLQEHEERLKNRLISIASERNVQGRGVRLTKVLRRGSIDYTAIPELKAIDLESYRKRPSDYWKLSVLSDD